MKKFLKWLNSDTAIKIILIALVFLGLRNVLFSSAIEPSFMLWMLGLFSYHKSLSFDRQSETTRNLGKKYSYFFIFCSIIFSFFHFFDIGWICILFGVILFFGGFKYLLYSIIPILLWFLAIPNIENLHQVISYPIRLVSSELTSSILSWFGLNISSKGSVIYLNNNAIAITTACSGIEQLETILVLGWIWVLYVHRSIIFRIIHYGFILPSIIFANIIRLICMMLLINANGENAITENLHFWLGIMMIVIASFIIILITPLFPNLEKNEIK